MQTEEELINQFRGGDKAAGEKILLSYKNMVRSLVRKYTFANACGDTEDLIQEGMCGLYSAMTTYSGGSGFSTYAYACIRNRIIDALKKTPPVDKIASENMRAISGGEDGIVSDGFSPEETLINTESASEFEAKMKKLLSPLEYAAISMYVDGATMNEIAAAMNMTYKQADNAITRAKAKLRNKD